MLPSSVALAATPFQAANLYIRGKTCTKSARLSVAPLLNFIFMQLGQLAYISEHIN